MVYRKFQNRLYVSYIKFRVKVGYKMLWRIWSEDFEENEEEQIIRSYEWKVDILNIKHATVTTQLSNQGN